MSGREGGGGDEKPRVRVSVRAVVETTLHEADLSPAAGAARRMREGAAAHRARQGSEGARDADYRAEVALSAEYEGDAVILRVTGRADGVSRRADGVTVIEEIKLGAPGMALVPAHRAQAAMYGHMLCAGQGEARVCLRVTYVDAQGAALLRYEEEQDAPSLAAEFARLCAPAAAWEARRLGRRQLRDASLHGLPFPYPAYRQGQRRFAQNVYIAIRERKRLFAQAPTGIGKTMAALYPALVALREGLCARVLFLTARATGRQSALAAVEALAASGAQVMAAEIAAKDKVCPQASRDCRPGVCPLAEGFYDRLPAALDEALRAGGTFGRERVAGLAAQNALCPFELSLELARLCDVVIGDYNYVYDPFVAIDALWQGAGGACLLVDEAHQLGPRVRDAYSGGVSLDELRRLRRETGRQHGRRCALYRALSGAMAALGACAALPAFEEGRLDAVPEALRMAMDAVLEAAGEQLGAGGGAEAADAFRMAASFALAAKRFDARYAALCAGGEKHASLLLCCLDASPEILQVSRRARGVAYFSATLAPFPASQRALGSLEGDACLLLRSPFSASQLEARVLSVDIRYASRGETAPQVAAAIAQQLRTHAGNALVCFPSYAYLSQIYELVLGEDGLGGDLLLREARGMREEEKRALLAAFEERDGPRVVLFAVLGGAFCEGVDLPGERLRQVIVVSTGLPQPDAQVRAMQAYYDAQGEDGFLMAMTLPGMIRVIQAAGRLIRTETDEGSLLLIDSRFTQPRIRALLAGTLAGDALGLGGGA